MECGNIHLSQNWVRTTPQAQRRQPPSPTGTLDKKPTMWTYLDEVVVGWVDTQEQAKSRRQYHCHEPRVRIQDLSSPLRSRGESYFWSQIKNCWTWWVVPQLSRSEHLLNFAWVGKGDLQLLAEQRKASQTSKRKKTVGWSSGATLSDHRWCDVMMIDGKGVQRGKCCCLRSDPGSFKAGVWAKRPHERSWVQWHRLVRTTSGAARKWHTCGFYSEEKFCLKPNDWWLNNHACNG